MTNAKLMLIISTTILVWVVIVNIVVLDVLGVSLGYAVHQAGQPTPASSCAPTQRADGTVGFC